MHNQKNSLSKWFLHSQKGQFWKLIYPTSRFCRDHRDMKEIFLLLSAWKWKFQWEKISQILFFMGSSKNKDDATHEDFTCIFFNDLTPSNVRKAVKMTNFVSAKCNKKNSLMWCSWNWGIYIVVESQVWWFLMRKNV